MSFMAGSAWMAGRKFIAVDGVMAVSRPRASTQRGAAAKYPFDQQ
jgi:hypothetical protein